MFVEFIVPTFDRKFPLLSMLSSLAAQTDNDWGAHILVDGDKIEDFRHDFMSILNLPNIRLHHTKKRFNDWGHSLRIIGKEDSEADYIIMTGDDNYYTPNLVEELRKVSYAKPALIYWDMVHSHYNYQYFKCYPAYNQIDMGAFATRNDIAKQVCLNTTYAADGEFIRDITIKFPEEKIIKIDKVLFVHN